MKTLDRLFNNGWVKPEDYWSAVREWADNIDMRPFDLALANETEKMVACVKSATFHVDSADFFDEDDSLLIINPGLLSILKNDLAKELFRLL